MLNFLSNLNSDKIQDKLPTNHKHLILESNLKECINTYQNQILFGCGCFWGAEKGFWRLPGVKYTAVGYAGGSSENPTYKEVCSGVTGHTEVVKIIWDEKVVDLSDLLKLFWECHDPTQGNRQGNDVGSQYRSAIYTYNQEHYKKAMASKTSYENSLTSSNYGLITTEIKKDVEFYMAENYHQQYLARPGSRPYCSAMPTKIYLKGFEGNNFKLDSKTWDRYNWNIPHCILRGDNAQIKLGEGK